jgi:uncharacterized membrane protein YidH (DUF202 family)
MSFSPYSRSLSPEPATPAPRSLSPLPQSPDRPKNSVDDVQQSIVQQSHPKAADPPRDPPSGSISSPRHERDRVPATVLPFKLSLTLQNTGSVARDHLASERTFLAYVRTSLAFASAGVGASSLSRSSCSIHEFHTALVQLFRVSTSSSSTDGSPDSGKSVVPYARPLGAALIAFGMAVLAMGEFSLLRMLQRDGDRLDVYAVQRHDTLFRSSACVAPRTLPCCPLECVSTWCDTCGTCRNRVWHPPCRALILRCR